MTHDKNKQASREEEEGERERGMEGESWKEEGSGQKLERGPASWSGSSSKADVLLSELGIQRLELPSPSLFPTSSPSLSLLLSPHTPNNIKTIKTAHLELEETRDPEVGVCRVEVLDSAVLQIMSL